MGFEAKSAILNNQLISSYDFLDPQEVNTLFQQHGDQFLPTFQILRSMGREKMVSASTWDAFEDNYIVENFQEGAGIAGGGTTCTLTLAATDVDASGYSYPRVGDSVLFSNDAVGRIETKTVGAMAPFTTTLAIRLYNVAQVVPAVPLGTTIAIVSGAFATGTDMPAAATRGVTKRTFYTQIVKERIGSEGGALADAVKCSVMEDGGTISGYYSTAIWDIDYRLAQKIDGAFWVGQENSNAVTQTSSMTGQANTVYTTKGLIPHASARGLTLNHGGAFTLANFDTIGAYLTGQRVTSQYIMGINGYTLDNYINNLLYNSNLNTGVDFTTMSRSIFGGDEGMAMSINFNIFRKGNFTYLFKCNTNFSNPKTFGSTGLTFPSRGVWMPLSKMKDPKTGEAQNNIEVRFKGLGNYSRRFKVFTISGAGEVEQILSTVDGTNTYEMAELGLGAMKCSQLVYCTI